jgi:hypothetical protein
MKPKSARAEIPADSADNHLLFHPLNFIYELVFIHPQFFGQNFIRPWMNGEISLDSVQYVFACLVFYHLGGKFPKFFDSNNKGPV